jgi:hypothetical protein
MTTYSPSHPCSRAAAHKNPLFFAFLFGSGALLGRALRSSLWRRTWRALRFRSSLGRRMRCGSGPLRYSMLLGCALGFSPNLRRGSFGLTLSHLGSDRPGAWSRMVSCLLRRFGTFWLAALRPSGWWSRLLFRWYLCARFRSGAGGGSHRFGRRTSRGMIVSRSKRAGSHQRSRPLVTGGDKLSSIRGGFMGLLNLRGHGGCPRVVYHG